MSQRNALDNTIVQSDSHIVLWVSPGQRKQGSEGERIESFLATVNYISFHSKQELMRLHWLCFPEEIQGIRQNKVSKFFMFPGFVCLSCNLQIRERWGAILPKPSSVEFIPWQPHPVIIVLSDLPQAADDKILWKKQDLNCELRRTSKQTHTQHSTYLLRNTKYGILPSWKLKGA